MRPREGCSGGRAARLCAMTLQSTLVRFGGAARVGTLLAAGFTAADLRSALSSGRVIRVRKGWLANEDVSADVLRAVEFGGRIACLSAARHRGLWVPEADGRTHVSVPRHAGRVHGDRAHLVVHWQSVPWSARASVVEPVPSIIRDLLLCQIREDALTAIDSALHTGALTTASLRRVLATLPPGFASVLDEVDRHAESGLETYCRVRLTPLGVRIRSQVHIPAVGYVDLVLGDRLVIEADGREWHEGPNAFLADRSRDLALTRLGYIVIRVAYPHIVDEWQRVELAIRGMVERGEHLWSPRHVRAGLAR
ncbi:MAG: DUF559 domain-containing protein [Leifsonia sp.]|nr:DUF559 domain-containing protein [Leifsonia sp.]